MLSLFQAFERYQVSAHNQGLSYACVAIVKGVDALRINPAALGLLSKNIVGFGYEYTFAHTEGLQNIFAGFVRPLLKGGIGLGVSQFGFAEQKENGITTGLGLGLGKDFYFGTSGDLYLIQNKRTGTGVAYGINIGMLGILAKKWLLGVYGRNLNQPQFGNAAVGTLPFSLQAGLGYKPFEDIVSEIDISVSDQTTCIYTSGAFALLDFLNLRTGFKTAPVSLSFGFGVEYKNIKVDYAVEYLVDLPLNHTVSLSFDF